MLRGPRFVRLFPDTYVPAGSAIDYELLSRAAYVLVEGKGALAGHSAAVLLRASCEPRGAPAEVVVPHRMRSHPRLRVHEQNPSAADLLVIGRTVVTSPTCTAFDLGRRKPIVEAIVAVDALARIWRFDPDAVLAVARRRLGARGSAQLQEVVRRADRRSGSPMASRIRIAIDDAGLPLPVLQHAVGPHVLDLAYPAIRLAIEYHGIDHLDPAQARRDLERQAYLSRAGWTVLRPSASDVLVHPERFAARVRGELLRRGMILPNRT